MSNYLKSTAYYVYCFTNKINGKKYVGKTNDLKKRLNKHKYANGSSPYFHKAVKKYGMNEFYFHIIGEYQSEKEASQMEIYYIDLYKSNNRENGYNLTTGGEGSVGFKHTEMSKLKISKAKTGCPGHWLGKVRPDEAKKKQSTTMMGRYAGDKH